MPSKKAVARIRKADKKLERAASVLDDAMDELWSRETQDLSSRIQGIINSVNGFREELATATQPEQADIEDFLGTPEAPANTDEPSPPDEVFLPEGPIASKRKRA